MQATFLLDHLGGFDKDFNCGPLATCQPATVYVEYILPEHVKSLYPHLKICFNANLMIQGNSFHRFFKWQEPPQQVEKTNFLCSFNKGKHLSRAQFLLHLWNAGFYNSNFCSKGFVINPDEIERFYTETQNVVLSDEINQFCNTITQFEEPTVATNNNMWSINASVSPLIQQSFITVVSEVLADSYMPFPTEKICFPIINKALWLAHAQPNYHSFVEQYLGFKPYVGFDYSFDQIIDPTERLVALMAELKRLQQLSEQDKLNLYQVNQKNIDHNFQILATGKIVDNLLSITEIERRNFELIHIAAHSRIYFRALN